MLDSGGDGGEASGQRVSYHFVRTKSKAICRGERVTHAEKRA